MQYSPAQKKAYAKKKVAQRKKAAPKKIYYKGNGAYTKKASGNSDWLAPPRSLGSTIGGWLGHGAHQIIKAVTGFGDYSVQYNSLMSGGIDPPELINNRRSGGIVVRHREYIMDIVGSQNFTIDELPLNPGLVSTFPWLSTIASSFEEYRLRGCIFEFKSMSSDAVLSNTTNSALGTVIMATQYNSLSQNFPDKKTMENYEFANSSKPSLSFLHPIECKQSINPVQELYVRTGTPTSGDLRLYDLGNFYIATQGQQADGGVIGELWATFEVEFFKPKLISALGYNLLTDHWHLENVTNVHPLGNGSYLAEGSQLGSIVSSYRYLDFPVNMSDGEFLITYNLIGASATLNRPSWTYVNCTGVPLFFNNASSTASSTGATATSFVMLLAVSITAPGAQVVFDVDGLLPVPVTAGDLIITQINGNILS